MFDIIQKVYSQNIYWMNLEAEVMSRTGQLEIAKEHATTVTKLEPSFPEGYLLLYKILEKQKLNSIEPGKKYLLLCKSLTHKLRRQWIFEPRLCREVNDIELTLRKKGGVNE